MTMATDWKDLLGALEVEPGAPDEPVKSTGTPAAAHRSVTLFYETKGRAGKPATILADFKGMESDAQIAELAADLKKALGTGGSARGGEILIQGDRRAPLRKLLAARGFTVKG